MIENGGSRCLKALALRRTCTLWAITQDPPGRRTEILATIILLSVDLGEHARREIGAHPFESFTDRKTQARLELGMTYNPHEPRRPRHREHSARFCNPAVITI